MKISLNHCITPKIIGLLYWILSATVTVLIFYSSWPLGKKLTILALLLIPMRIFAECLVILFKLLESQNKTCDILEKIHHSLSSRDQPQP